MEIYNGVKTMIKELKEKQIKDKKVYIGDRCIGTINPSIAITAYGNVLPGSKHPYKQK